jgi:hypothetical protein
MVLYSIYWVFGGNFQKKEGQKGKVIVVTDVHASSLHLSHMIINSIKYTV